MNKDVSLIVTKVVIETKHGEKFVEWYLSKTNQSWHDDFTKAWAKHSPGECKAYQIQQQCLIEAKENSVPRKAWARMIYMQQKNILGLITGELI